MRPIEASRGAKEGNNAFLKVSSLRFYAALYVILLSLRHITLKPIEYTCSA